MRDSEVVAAIVAGDPDGLAEAYDRYAAPLYRYCRTLLREPADAADAVQDTFVVAASKLAGLRDPNRLRAWLYAVARNECHGRLRAGKAQVPTPLDDLLDVTDAAADVSDEAEREELRTLLRSAVRGLNGGEQDLIELQLRQGLDVAEIAAVLGVSRNHAHALLSRARGQLETSLGALLVARSGRDDCDALSAMLDGWDGQLTVLMRKRINRHIEGCRACTGRKKRELSPALLLGAAPLAAALPAELRTKVLRVARSYVPAAAAYRAKVTRRVGTFGHRGFPRPLDRPKSPWWRPRGARAATAAAGATTVAAASALVAMTLTAGSAGHHGGASALGSPGGGPGTHAVISGSAAGGATGARERRKAPVSRGDAGFAPSPAADVTVPGLGGTGGAPRMGGSSGYWVAGGPGAAGTGTAGSGSGAGGSGGSGSSGTAAGSGTKTTPATGSSGRGGTSSSAPATKTSGAPPPSAGTLSVSPGSLVLTLGGAGTVTLTASGGSVNWSITESAGLVGHLAVSPSSGTLAAGQSTTVSVSAGLLTLAGSLTVEPAGITVSVVIGTDL
jgi:RNA polymerase sigma factor (sigma-70 family)